MSHYSHSEINKQEITSINKDRKRNHHKCGHRIRTLSLTSVLIVLSDLSSAVYCCRFLKLRRRLRLVAVKFCRASSKWLTQTFDQCTYTTNLHTIHQLSQCQEQQQQSQCEHWIYTMQYHKASPLLVTILAA